MLVCFAIWAVLKTLAWAHKARQLWRERLQDACRGCGRLCLLARRGENRLKEESLRTTAPLPAAAASRLRLPHKALCQQSCFQSNSWCDLLLARAWWVGRLGGPTGCLVGIFLAVVSKCLGAHRAKLERCRWRQSSLQCVSLKMHCEERRFDGARTLSQLFTQGIITDLFAGCTRQTHFSHWLGNCSDWMDRFQPILSLFSC